jgi:hypothetical protein
VHPIFVQARLKPILTPKRRSLKDIKHFLAGNKFGQIETATINGVHQQAHTARVCYLRNGGVFFQKIPQAVAVTFLQELESRTDSVFH